MHVVLTTVEQPVYQQDLMAARALFARGDASYKEACEHLLKAQAAGASQREMAKAIGRSQTTVNRYLKWHADGCDPAGPFAPDNERHHKRLVTNHSSGHDPDEADDDQDDRDTAAGRHEKAERNLADPDAVKARKPSQRAELFAWLATELDACVLGVDADGTDAFNNVSSCKQIQDVAYFLRNIDIPVTPGDSLLEKFKKACEFYLPQLNAFELKQAVQFVEERKN
jgi:hypothetical protein